MKTTPHSLKPLPLTAPQGSTTKADPNCTNCGGTGWIGDIACPCTTPS